MRRLALLALAGCGRIDFDARLDARTSDGAAPGTVVFGASTAYTAGTSMTTTTIPVPAVAAGDVLVVATINFNIGGIATAMAAIQDDAGNQYVDSGQRAHWESMQGLLQIWYARVVAPPSIVTIDSVATTTRETWIAQLSNVTTDGDPIDAIAALDDVPGSVTPAAATVTPSVSGAGVLSLMQIDGVVQGIAPGNPFTALATLNGDAAATYVAAAGEPCGAVWTAPGSSFTASLTIAFRPGS